MESTPTLNVQHQHVSIRSFTDEDIPDQMLTELLEAGRRAPTSSNMQAYSIVVVRDQAVKRELSILAGHQQHIEACPVFLAYCADLYRLRQACEMHEIEMTNNLETFLVSTIDAALVGMSVQTGAESLGLGAVMVGAMRNHPKEVADLLGLPPHVYVTFGMSLGWPDEDNIPPQKPRLPRDLVIHEEKYNLVNPVPKIEAHDKELARHYISMGKNLDSAAWSGVIARNMGRPLRSSLIDTLESMGFTISRV